MHNIKMFDNDFRSKIHSALQSQRPSLSSSSLRTYSSVLFNLHTKHMKRNHNDIEWFSNQYQSILDYLNTNTKKSTRKSILSALYVLTNRPEYREQMIADAKDINEEYREQKKSQKQRDNWISVQQIKDKYEELYDRVQNIFKKRAIGDISVIMDYLLVGFLGGVLIPPRRSLDYALLKWRDYDKKTDNYYSRGNLYFNRYKTSDTYGLTVVDVPKDLNTVLKKWLKINPSAYVLMSSNGNPLSSSQITRSLNRIFGKQVSVNMLRHIFLTNYYENMPKLTAMHNIASKMGHNLTTALEYAKKD